MKIESRFSPGDKAYCMVGHDGVEMLTIGQVSIEITDSPGMPGESMFDNYKPQNKQSEKYMCVESGIGSGSVFTLGESIFDNAIDAIAAYQRWKDEYETAECQ